MEQARLWTRDLSIASPTTWPLHHTARHYKLKLDNLLVVSDNQLPGRRGPFWHNPPGQRRINLVYPWRTWKNQEENKLTFWITSLYPVYLCSNSVEALGNSGQINVIEMASGLIELLIGHVGRKNSKKKIITNLDSKRHQVNYQIYEGGFSLESHSHSYGPKTFVWCTFKSFLYYGMFFFATLDCQIRHHGSQE